MRCTECGTSNDDHIAFTGRALDVHRLNPGSPYSVEGCVSLCRSCHGPKPKSVPCVRIREPLAAQLLLLTDRNATDFTEEINRAVREMLVREHLWPPRPDAAD